LKNEGSFSEGRHCVCRKQPTTPSISKAVGEGEEHSSSGDIRKQLGQAHQVVGCGREAEGPCDAIHSSKPGLVLAGDRFDPSEGFLDTFANALADRVANMPCRPPIDGGAPPVGILCAS